MSDKDLSGTHTWLVLWKARDAIKIVAEKSIGDTGLILSEFGILEMLLHKGPLPVNIIGRTLNLTTGSITTAIDRLESKGLVERCSDPNDKRIRVVHLTDAGRDLIGPAFQRHQRDMDELVSVLTPEERSTLQNLLKRLGKNAQSAQFKAE